MFHFIVRVKLRYSTTGCWAMIEPCQKRTSRLAGGCGRSGQLLNEGSA
jgi:hypothetical protein